MRQELIAQIDAALKQRGSKLTFTTVTALRREYPGIPTPLNLEGLTRLLKTIPTADLEAWRTPRQRKIEHWRQADRPQKRKTTTSYEKIYEMRTVDRMSYAAIGKQVGLTRERIRQICERQRLR